MGIWKVINFGIIGIVIISIVMLVGCSKSPQKTPQPPQLPYYKVNDIQDSCGTSACLTNLYLVVERNLTKDDAWKIVSAYKNKYKTYELLTIDFFCDPQYATKQYLNSDISDKEYYTHVMYLYSYHPAEAIGEAWEGGETGDGYGTACT